MNSKNNPVTSEYLKRVALLASELKSVTYDEMRIESGHKVLDVGCGPAIDTLKLAEEVGQDGQVEGIDADESMIQEANEIVESAGLSGCVRHQLGSAESLPYEDASFDSIRAERLLQVLPSSVSPERVVGEMKRVLKPEGRLVLCDTDWATFSIDTDLIDTERSLCQFFASKLRPSGYAGRALYRYAVDSGLRDVEVKVFPMCHFTLDSTPINWMLKEAASAKIVPESDLIQFKEELQSRESKGRFFASVNLLVVSGTKN